MSGWQRERVAQVPVDDPHVVEAGVMEEAGGGGEGVAGLGAVLLAPGTADAICADLCSLPLASAR